MMKKDVKSSTTRTAYIPRVAQPLPEEDLEEGVRPFWKAQSLLRRGTRCQWPLGDAPVTPPLADSPPTRAQSRFTRSRHVCSWGVHRSKLRGTACAFQLPVGNSGPPTFDLTGSNKGSITPVTVSRDHRGSRLKPANSPLQPRYCFVLVPSFLRCEELNVFRSSQYSRDLTPNEIAVLQLMMAGYKFSTIATLLGCRHHTVRGRAWRIYNKLGADNRVQAVLFATDLGILDPLAFYGS